MKQPFNLYRFTGQFLNFRTALGLFVLSLTIGTIGYIHFENYTITDALYMSISALSTVGFGEVKPLSVDGRVFSSVLILLNFGIFAYAASTFSFYLIRGEFFKRIHIKLINQKISRLRNHIIVCGYGKFGKEIASHLTLHNIPFVIVEKDGEVIREVQSNEERLLYIHSDASHDQSLVDAGVGRAKALISALPNDTDNVFAVLSARQLNPNLNIISRSANNKVAQKIKLAGANHVITPEQIGGFFMATLISKPDAVDFFTYLTSERDADICFEEIHFHGLPPSFIGKTIRQMEIRSRIGANVIGQKLADGSFIINPTPDTSLKAKESFIVLGNPVQLAQLKQLIQKNVTS